MCEAYDHDTRMARDQEIIAALNGGASKDELIAKLQAEVDEAKAKGATARAQAEPFIVEQSEALEAQWMAEDLIEFVTEFEPTRQAVTV